MAGADYIIILVYFLGLLVLGATVGRKIKTSEDMFIAGRNSSWWLSGLSTYMTIFSAGTFVVWGGVAYRSGLVAVVVGMMLGIASIMVGRLLAGKWARLQINSPAEYLGIRFDRSTVRFFSVVGIVGRGVHMAVALYAVAIMTVALIPLPEGHILADPVTGHLSVTYAILFLGIITFIYTAAGGFVAVLMTDVVQFAVLMAMVLIMVPQSFSSVGGIDAFLSKAPEGYFSLFSDQYSWGWMILWCLLNFFVIGGDWAFVQRYISVPTPKAARKSIYLVAILYFITPIIWYVPALVYRTINPDANPEQAYMLMSQHILSAGMIGIMLAAMISATLSTVSGTLNVFANIFTYDIFKVLRPAAPDRKLMTVGRVFTYAYGLVITVVAVLIPYMGGAERVVVSILTLVISPLFIPSVWGLFSRKIGYKSVWFTMCTTYLAGLAIKFGLFSEFVDKHPEFVDAFIGLVFPVTILLILEFILRKKGADPGWHRYTGIIGNEERKVGEEKIKKSGSKYSDMAFKIMVGTYAAIGLIIGILSFVNKSDRLQMRWYAAIFLVISSVAWLLYYFRRKKIKTPNEISQL